MNDGVWLDTGGARLWIRVTGQSVPLVLVHGWAMDHRVFDFQIETLAQHFKVVTFDRRGFGRSVGPPDLNRECEDLDAIAAGILAGERFHLLGMSQGGRVAARYAASRPERLRSLILQGAAVDGDEPDGPPEERIPLGMFTDLAATGRLDELRRTWLGHPLMRLAGRHVQAQRLLRDMLADYRGDDLIDDPAERRPAVDVLGALSKLTVPVLVLTGARETAARRRTARRLSRTLPDAREVVLPDSGHLCNLDEPERCNAAVMEFCNSTDASDTRTED